jgi:hypothetical protein
MAPGNLDNSYIQKVPLVGTTLVTQASLHAAGRTIEPRIPDELILARSGLDDSLQITASPLVFAGYGIVAPQAGRDDYKGLDVTGRTVLILPSLPKAVAGQSALDPAANSFDARRQIALSRGAAAVLMVHDSSLVGFAFSAAASSSRGERLRLDEPAQAERAPSRITGRLPHELLVLLLPSGTRDWNALKEAAARRDFRPIALDATIDAKVIAHERKFISRNIVGVLPAANLRDEYVVYTAHYDHLGRDSTLQGDQIFNGAVDNAGGVAQLIEIARAFVMLPRAHRSILFIATTAEESGMLGARYYTLHPLHPLERTLADINLDWFLPWPETHDYFETSFGSSTLDSLLVGVAREQGRTVSKDPWPEQNFYLRSDHYPFAQAGIPSLFGGMGIDIVGKGKEYGEKLFEQYDRHDYHAVTDSIRSDWVTAGALQDAALLFAVGHAIAAEDSYPEWMDDPQYAAYKAKRVEALSRKR